MLKLLITWHGTTYDYTNNLDQTSIDIQEELNIPTTFTFNLEPVGVFTVPPARAYVQLLSTQYNISLFTGFISVPPTQGFKSLDNPVAAPGGQRFVYQFSAISDEFLLNMKAIQFIPSYINRTQGQILSDLAEILCPGFFDTSMIASGDLVPQFDYDSTHSWSEVAKTFADASRYRYKVRDKKIWFQPYGDNVLGISYNEATQPQSQIFPKQLDTQVLAVPIVNDVLVIGDAEAGNNREDYFLGDGFTGNFPLRHKTFQGTSTMILQETWANASLNTQSWYNQDPDNNFDYSAGALNVVTASGLFTNLGQSYLSMKNGVEIAGGLQLDHGEFTFNDKCEGIVGGLYLDTDYAATGTVAAPGADLIAGFQLTTPSPSVPGVSGGIGGVHLVPFLQGVGGTQLLENQLQALADIYIAQTGATGLNLDNWLYYYVQVINGRQYTGTEVLDMLTALGLTPETRNTAISLSSFLGVVPNLTAMIVTQQNHNYVLQTLIHAPKYTRYQRKYTTIDGQVFGGVTDAIKGSVTFRILDYDIAAATGFFYEPTLYSLTAVNVTLPPFCTYALINNVQLNLTDSYTTLATMPLGTLQACEGPLGLSTPTGLVLPSLPANSGQWFSGATKYLGPVASFSGLGAANIMPPPLPRSSKSTSLVLGNGFALQDAQYTQGNSADTLAFYAQTLPAAGTPVRLQSWESQAAVSRLQDQASISGEAYIVGDDGVRSAIISNMNPLPRTSEDADNAALAFLADRVNTSYNGRYVIQDTPVNPIFVGASGDVQWWPTVGRFLHVNAPYRGLASAALLVSKITLSVLDMKTETMQWVLQFGSDLNLEKVLHNFVDVRPAVVLTSIDTANPPNPRFTISASSTYLADLNDVFVDITGPISPTGITVNVGDPWTGQIEVRRLDTNWGRGSTPDYIATVTGPQFTLKRQQFDEIWYMRPVDGTKTSRRSKVLRVRYPREPAHPVFVSNNNGLLQFQVNGDIRNIYGFELRTPPLPIFSGYNGNQVVLYQRPVASLANLNLDVLNQTPLPQVSGFPYSPMDVYAYFFNADWVYSDPTIVQLTGTNFGNYPYPWATAGSGTAIAANQLLRYRNPNFGIRLNAQQMDPNGFITPQFVLAGSGIANTFSKTTSPPISVVASTDQVGGTIGGGVSCTVGVWAIGSDGLATEMTTETIIVPPGTDTNTVTVDVEFANPATDSGYAVITIYPPEGWFGNDLVAPTGGYIPVHSTSFTFQNIGNYVNVPDARFHHFVVQARTGYVLGANGGAINGITGNIIGFPQNVGATSGQVFPTSGEWVGRTATCYGKGDYTQWVPIIDVPINAVSGYALDIGPDAGLLASGDYMLVRLRADMYLTDAQKILLAASGAQYTLDTGLPLNIDNWTYYYQIISGNTIFGAGVEAMILQLGLTDEERGTYITSGAFLNAMQTSLIGDPTLLYWKNLNLQNLTLSDGLTPHLYAGKLMFPTRGTGAGLAPLQILDNDEYSFALSPASTIPFGRDTEFIVINSFVDYEFTNSQQVFNSKSATGQFSMNVSVDNAVKHFFVQVLTTDAAGDQSVMSWSPYRLILNPGFAQGGASGFGNPQETFIVGFGPGGVPADIPLWPGGSLSSSGTSNLAIEKVAGTMYGWDAICEIPPSGADLLFDIIRYRGNPAATGSIFADSSQYIRIPDGAVGVQSGFAFGLNSDIQKDDLLQLVVMQVGSASPGQRATVNLYWKNIPQISPISN